jgi:hypothetical protein
MVGTPSPDSPRRPITEAELFNRRLSLGMVKSPDDEETILAPVSRFAPVEENASYRLSSDEDITDDEGMYTLSARPPVPSPPPPPPPAPTSAYFPVLVHDNVPNPQAVGAFQPRERQSGKPRPAELNRALGSLRRVETVVKDQHQPIGRVIDQEQTHNALTRQLDLYKQVKAFDADTLVQHPTPIELMANVGRRPDIGKERQTQRPPIPVLPNYGRSDFDDDKPNGKSCTGTHANKAEYTRRKGQIMWPFTPASNAKHNDDGERKTEKAELKPDRPPPPPPKVPAVHVDDHDTPKKTTLVRNKPHGRRPSKGSQEVKWKRPTSPSDIIVNVNKVEQAKKLNEELLLPKIFYDDELNVLTRFCQEYVALAKATMKQNTIFMRTSSHFKRTYDALELRSAEGTQPRIIPNPPTDRIILLMTIFRDSMRSKSKRIESTRLYLGEFVEGHHLTLDRYEKVVTSAFGRKRFIEESFEVQNYALQAIH